MAIDISDCIEVEDCRFLGERDGSGGELIMTFECDGEEFSIKESLLGDNGESYCGGWIGSLYMSRYSADRRGLSYCD